MLMSAVKDLQKTSKDLYAFFDFFLKEAIATFSKNLSKNKAVMDKNTISTDHATQKKQYIQICSIGQEANEAAVTSGKVLKFSELVSVLQIPADDVEEWCIEAINNDIIDARIDQIKEEIVIKTCRQRHLNTEEWNKVKSRISAWRARFQAIEEVLKH